MKDMRRVLVRSGSCSQKTRIIVAIAMAALWGLPGVFPGVGSQAFAQTLGSQNLDPLQNYQQNLNNGRFPVIPRVGPPKRTEKQKQALLNYNFQQMKKHASDLAELAESLQKEIAATNENVLSLKIVKKAKKIQKLAKKIENELKGD